jgi:YqaJ-like viral recombinase domain
MRVLCGEQNCQAWFEARLGRVTASNISRAMAKLKRASDEKKAGDWAADHDNYVCEITWELITHTPAEHYVSKAMELGTEYENEARIEYWQATGIEVDETGFVLHPTHDFLGASPDGLIGFDGGLEIKVPLLSTHQRYLVEDQVPDKYIPQMQCAMLCCERQWWDFVSYAPGALYPELPEEFRFFRKRLTADPAMHREMEEAAIATMAEATALVSLLTERYGRAEPRDRKIRPEPESGPIHPLNEDFSYLDRVKTDIP